jgi:hypothetical protein
MVIYLEIDLAAKVDMWLKAENFYRGHHARFPDLNHPNHT